MSKSAEKYWIIIILTHILLFTGVQTTAQEVYFAEDPPMALDAKAKQISGFIVEYSAKNNGLIQLELVQNKKTVIGKGTFVVKKRGSNTATITLKILSNDKNRTSNTNYEYRLTLFEDSRATKAPAKSINSMIPHTTLTPITTPVSKLKKIGETSVISGVTFL